VAINEIKRDRDERIKTLRDELDATTKHFEELTGANSALVVQYEHQKGQYESLKTNYDRLVENLTVANKIRQEKEEALSKKTKEYTILSKQYEDSIKRTEQLTKENEKQY
jgi:predicted nuclease with TOPRIM domain